MFSKMPGNLPEYMRVISWEDFISGKESVTEQAALTIGVFDGVHIGHQRLIREITGKPENLPCAITFTRNPATVLGRQPFPGNISSLEQKLTKLEIFGVRLVILIDFSLEFSKIIGTEFIHLISGRCKIEKIAVGTNFHFGHKKKNSVWQLQSLFPSTPVKIVEPVICNGKPVSSTLIRKLIRDGDMDKAAAMLGSAYELDVQGFAPAVTVNGQYRILKEAVRHNEQLIPGDGVYSAIAMSERGKYPAKIVIQHDEIIWEKQKDSDYSNMKSILFISKRS